MCDIGWYVISTGISVTDLLIKAIVGEIMVNSTAEAIILLIDRSGSD